MSGSEGQNGGSLREMALTAPDVTTGSVIVGVTNVGIVNNAMQKDKIASIQKNMARCFF